MSFILFSVSVLAWAEAEAQPILAEGDYVYVENRSAAQIELWRISDSASLEAEISFREFGVPVAGGTRNGFAIFRYETEDGGCGIQAVSLRNSRALWRRTPRRGVCSTLWLGLAPIGVLISTERDRSRAISIDMTSGSEIWMREAPRVWADDRSVVLHLRDHLEVLTASTGRTRFFHTITSSAHATWPIFSRDLLFLQPSKHRIVALDLGRGIRAWEHEVEGEQSLDLFSPAGDSSVLAGVMQSDLRVQWWAIGSGGTRWKRVMHSRPIASNDQFLVAVGSAVSSHDYLFDSLTIVNAATGLTTMCISAEGSAYAITPVPSGDFVAVTNSKSVWRISPLRRTVTRIFLGPDPRASRWKEFEPGADGLCSASVSADSKHVGFR